MALDWSVEDCADHHELMADTMDGYPVTECTVWLCMICGVDVITPDTAERLWHRIRAWEIITGPLNSNGRPMMPNDIRRRIGLRTNASTLTDIQWRKKVIDIVRRDSQAKWHRMVAGRHVE